MKHRFVVEDANEAGERLDRFLAQHLADTRSQVQRQIDLHGVQVNGKPSTAHYRIKLGDVVHITIPDRIERHRILVPSIVAETDDYLVLEKPSGLLTHPTERVKETTLVEWLLEHDPDIQNVGEAGRPGIVHRIDRDVSGLLLVAKTQEFFQEAQRQFRERHVKKIYLALVEGIPLKAEGELRFRLARSRRHRGRIAARPESAEGKDAVTKYSVERTFRATSLLSLELITGRTHQIRAHLFAFGHPIVGDTLYRAKKAKKEMPITRPFLHAHRLGFFDLQGKWQDFVSPLPEELAIFLKELEEAG